MPFKCPDLQKTFTFAADGERPGGLPVVAIERWGNGLYIKVCLLCGMVHEIRCGLPDDMVFRPNCIVKQSHPHVYQEWTKQHPEAANFRHVRLVIPTGTLQIRPIPNIPRPQQFAALAAAFSKAAVSDNPARSPHTEEKSEVTA